MSEALNRLRGEIEQSKTVTTSAIALLTGLSTEIRDLAEQVAAGKADEVDINALADSLDASTNELADAISAGTPAADLPSEEAPAEEPAAGEPAAEGDSTEA